MFEVGFTEILLICAIALLVLGPERLPKLAADLGRWAGRARAMARQLRTQLEQEVHYDPLKDSPGSAPTIHAPPASAAATRCDPVQNPAPATPSGVEPVATRCAETPADAMNRSTPEPEALAEATLISHLLELRTRLLRATVAVCVVFLPLAFYANQLFTLAVASRSSKSCRRGPR